MTQSDVARVLKISPATIARIESGGREAPRFQTVAAIAKVIGVSLDTLAVEAGLMTAAGPLLERRLKARVAAAVRVARKARAGLADLEQVLRELEAVDDTPPRPRR